MFQRWTPDRRAIVKALGLAVAAETVPFAGLSLAQDNQNSLSCFVEEGGRRGTWPLVVGALTTREPDRHSAEIRALRTTHSYKRRLTYASNDRHKLKFAAGVIDYFAVEAGLRFVALVVTDDDKRWPKTTAEKDAVYFDLYKRLLDTIRNDGGSNVLLRKRNRTATGRDKLLHDFLSNASAASAPNAGLTIQPELSKREELTQLSAFLASCIRGDIVGASVRKTGPIVQLKDRLGVKDFWDVSAARLAVTTVNL
jgi:hypothetical protein